MAKAADLHSAYRGFESHLPYQKNLKEIDMAKKTKKEEELEARIKELEKELDGKDLEMKRKLALQEILDNFDYEKVERVCNFLNWQVYDPTTKGEDSDSYVPVTVDMLIKDTERFAKDCWKAFDTGEAKEEYMVGSGPLELWWCECKEGVFAHLKFVCEDWRVEPG